MREQSFEQAVRESRLFYRRRLAERLAMTQLRHTGGVNPANIVARAREITEALSELEDAELVGTR